MGVWPFPRQEFCDAVDGMICDACEYRAEIGFWVIAVQLACFHKAIDSGGTFSTGVRSCEQPVFSSRGYATDGSLCCVIVDLEGAVIDASTEGSPPAQAIAHRLGHLGLGREPGSCCVDSYLQGAETRPRLVLPDTLPLITRLAADGVFNSVESIDAIKGFRGRGRRLRCELVEELAPDMRPQGSLGGIARFEDGIEPGIAIGVQCTCEGLELFLRVLALSGVCQESCARGRLTFTGPRNVRRR
jgi:hypothetical protein